MATRQRTRTTAISIRPRAAVVPKARYEELRLRTAAATRRLREASTDDTDALISVASALGIAMFEKSGHQLPTIFGIDPLLVWGTGGWLLTRGNKSKMAGMFRASSLAAVTIGTNRSAMRGSMRVEGDGGGEYEPLDDDSDDDSDDL
jgi:hypothetical protein